MSLASQAHFNNYDPSSFGWSRQVDLVPFTFGGVNFGQCARDVRQVFTALLTELVPHIPGGIAAGAHDDWAYSATDDLSDGSWSFHHYGIAFDLNWNHNPMGTYSTNPDAGQAGAIPHQIAHDIATKYGCEYGGDWSGGDGHRGFKDYMHFECHLSPSVARTVQLPAAVDPLEEVMAMYASKAEFEKAIQDNAYLGAARLTQQYDPATGKWDGQRHQIATLIATQLTRYGLTTIKAAIDAIKAKVSA